MTPAERQLVADLFDRLATLEDAQRDPDAERTIRDGLSQAPNAVYALVQTTLVQDEALKRANARIQELEAELGFGNEPPRQGGFLDTMRDNIFGRREEQRGSVPSVRRGDSPMGAPPGGFRTGAQPMGAPPGYGPGGQPMQMPPEPQRGGGSFLGTAAAAAAGVIGGSLLLNSIRGMMGNNPGGGVGLADPAAAAGGDNASPWGNSGGTGGNDDLGRQLGRDDLGRSSGQGRGGEQQQGLFSDAEDGKSEADGVFDTNSIENSDLDSGDFDGGGFDGGDGGGGSSGSGD